MPEFTLSLERKRDQRFIVLLGFVLLVLTVVLNGYGSLLRIILRFRDNASYEKFKAILNLADLILAGTVIVSGFLFGRRVDLSRNYRRYLSGLLLSWALAAVFLGVLYFSSEDIPEAVYQIALTNCIGGYTVFAPLFSGITLGWLVRDKPTIRKEWNKEVLRYVLIFQGINLIGSLGGSLVRVLYLHTGSSISTYTLYSQVSSFAFFLVSLWFMGKMYGVGKKVELDSDCGSVLFTLWAPRVAVIVIQSIVNLFMYQYTPVMWLLRLAEKIIWSPINVLGLNFAVLCLGYIHSRYRFLEKLEKIRQE